MEMYSSFWKRLGPSGSTSHNLEPRLSLFSSLVVERETLVEPDHVTIQNQGGKKIWWQRGVAKSRNCYCDKTVLMTHPPCGIVVFTGNVIRSNQGLSLDDKGGKEKRAWVRGCTSHCAIVWGGDANCEETNRASPNKPTISHTALSTPVFFKGSYCLRY